MKPSVFHTENVFSLIWSQAVLYPIFFLMMINNRSQCFTDTQQGGPDLVKLALKTYSQMQTMTMDWAFTYESSVKLC